MCLRHRQYVMAQYFGKSSLHIILYRTLKGFLHECLVLQMIKNIGEMPSKSSCPHLTSTIQNFRYLWSCDQESTASPSYSNGWCDQYKYVIESRWSSIPRNQSLQSRLHSQRLFRLRTLRPHARLSHGRAKRFQFEL